MPFQQTQSPHSQRSRRKIPKPNQIPDDVFLASSVGDVDWLKHTVSGWKKKADIPYDENVFCC